MSSRATIGYEADGNTSTAPLGGGATFTGAWELNGSYDVMSSCHASSAGTLYFDFSGDDGANYTTFPVNGFAVAAGIHEFHTAVKGPRSFRVRYVNGAVDQTYFRMYTYYGRFEKPNTPLNQAISLDSDATLTRSSLPWMDLSRGLLSGVTTIKKFGRNLAVATTYVPVSVGGVYQTPQAAAATALRVKAGNLNDTSAGSGAREITLEGLDENWAYVTETLNTAGTSASSATSATFTRLFRAYVSASGTYASAAAGSHAAAIVIENGAGGTNWATIDLTGFAKAQSEIAAYSVATGYTAYVFPRSVSVDSGKTIDLIFFQRLNVNETAAPYTAMRAQSVNIGIVAGIHQLDNAGGVPYGPYVGPCDIGFMAKGASTPAVSVEFDIYLLAE